VSARVLLLIPAFNEEKTIAATIEGLRRAAPSFDRLVVNDGSEDGTGPVVESLGERQLRLPCNVGYGNALQAGLEYAAGRDYDVVAFVDSDGQHDPADAFRVVQRLLEGDADVVIGSRFCGGRPYRTSLDRRIGMLVFSHLTRLMIGRRIYDTTSGLKALRRRAYRAILQGTFLDFHVETIVRLSMLGYRIEEFPIEVREREHGHSMHSWLSVFAYPTKTLLLTLVAAIDALVARRTR